MQLFQINRAKFISVNDQFRVENVSFRGGKSEWIISRKNTDGKYFSAIASAKTLAEAKLVYAQIAKAVA